MLAGAHDTLAAMVEHTLPKPARWWTDYPPDDSHATALPTAALSALEAISPSGWRFESYRRIAGVGSLGRPRYLAVGDRDGALAARELKQVAPPAGVWLGRPSTASALDAPGLVRARDPLYARTGGWLARRRAPDCIKLELARLHDAADTRKLFECMGRDRRRPSRRAAGHD